MTTLVLTHRLVERYDASNVGPGWHYCLDRLVAVITDLAVPDSWDDHYPSLKDTYALRGAAETRAKKPANERWSQ